MRNNGSIFVLLGLVALVLVSGCNEKNTAVIAESVLNCSNTDLYEKGVNGKTNEGSNVLIGNLTKVTHEEIRREATGYTEYFRFDVFELTHGITFEVSNKFPYKEGAINRIEFAETYDCISGKCFNTVKKIDWC